MYGYLSNQKAKCNSQISKIQDIYFCKLISDQTTNLKKRYKITKSDQSDMHNAHMQVQYFDNKD